jgi:hypothetical protein
VLLDSLSLVDGEGSLFASFSWHLSLVLHLDVFFRVLFVMVHNLSSDFNEDFIRVKALAIVVIEDFLHSI